jgi:hypothetical protein
MPAEDSTVILCQIPVVQQGIAFQLQISNDLFSLHRTREGEGKPAGSALGGARLDCMFPLGKRVWGREGARAGGDLCIF